MTGFDWQKVLNQWDINKENQRAEFMEHIYKCSGRSSKNHPKHSLYTGLWEEFCLMEAGPHCRDEYFARIQFVKDLESGKINPEPVVLG
jgi:hypothetical protein